MSKELTAFNPAKLPAFAKSGLLSDLAKSLAGGGGSSFSKRISIKGGVFRLLAGSEEVASIDDRHLDVVIVQAAPKISRTFYAGTYEEGSTKGPACWSADGEKPDAHAEDPQSSNCASCPQNSAGSGQGNSRACRYSQRLAVVLANDVGGDIMQLTLSATSIFGKEEGDKRPLQAYARYLAAQSINPETVVTRLRFDTKAAVPKLFFQPMRWLEQDEFETVKEKSESTEAKAAVVMSFGMGGTKKTAPAPALAAPKEAAESFDEPEKRKPAVKPSAVPKKKTGDLAAVVDEWDTDDE
jgi:hypothetical protein